MIVTRESEWDDVQRRRMLAYLRYKAGIHELCGFHDSIAREDPDVEMIDETCPLCAAFAAALRDRAKQENEAEKNLSAGARKKSDGRRTWLRMKLPGRSTRKGGGR